MTGENAAPRPLDAAAYADLLVGYCLEVEERDQVLVRSTALAAPLLLEVQRAVLERGGWPLLRVELPGQTAAFYEQAREWQLDEYAPLALTEARRATCTLGIQAPDHAAPPTTREVERLRRAALGRRTLREAVAKTRRCTTLWPTPAAAERAGMSSEDFAAFVGRALFLDQPDPAAAWAGLRAFQDRLGERLGRARELRLEAEGTDLVLDVAKRRWVNRDGRHSMPGGDLTTRPRSATGHARLTVAGASPGAGAGAVAGAGLVELEFATGEVTAGRPGRGADHLHRALGADTAGRRLRELSIATNFGIPGPCGMISFDGKIGGTVQLGLGSHSQGGDRDESAVLWTLVCDLRRGGRLSVDGELIQLDGRFVGI